MKNKKPLNEIIPTSLTSINNMLDEFRGLKLDDFPEEAKKKLSAIQKFMELIDEPINDFADFFAIFDPYKDTLPEGMHKEFSKIQKSCNKLLKHLDKDEINDLLMTNLLLAIKLPDNDRDFIEEIGICKLEELLQRKNEIELTTAFRHKKKIVWADLIAAYSLLNIYYIFAIWHSQYNENFISSEIGKFVSKLKLYQQCWLSTLLESYAACIYSTGNPPNKRKCSKLEFSS